MSGRDAPLWHRAAAIGDVVAAHRWLITRPEDLRVLLVSSDAERAAAVASCVPAAGVRVERAEAGSPGTASTPFDVVIRLGIPDAAELAALRRCTHHTGVLVVDVAGEEPWSLLDRLPDHFARCVGLTQHPVTGTALLTPATHYGPARIYELGPHGGTTPPTTPSELAIVIAGDRPLDHHAGPSVLSSPASPVERVERKARAGARRVARGLKRRVLRPVAQTTRITVPDSPEPRLSIVIPVHGKWPITEGCLAAIEALDLQVPTEVIVVDDASPDDTAARLRDVVGVHVVSLVDNVGFLRASNAGVAAARGELVLFLNNDTVPQRGSFDRMIERLDEDPTVGVVGAKLVYLDRTLQEAGGVIWRDGFGWNLGRNGDPSSPRHSYPLEVDYCSGAALLVRRRLLELTGGFDDRFAPAYYEDTDLCFEARRHGYRVVYEPRAVVVHLEGQSHGTSTTTGIKRYQEINREKFVEKWQAELADHLPSHPANPHLAKTRWATRRVLIVDATVPTYDRDGGSLRMFRLIKMLRETGCAVWFVPLDRLLRQPYTQSLLDLGVEVVDARVDLADLVGELAPGLDVVLLSRRGVAWTLIELLREMAPSVPIVFDTVDLHFVREEAEASMAVRRDPTTDARARAWRGRQMELALVSLADQTWVVSHEEQELLEALVPDASVQLIPNVHGSERIDEPFTGRRDLVFVGNFRHPPNVDAVTWLADEVLPLVRQQLPDVRLHVVGDGLPDDVRAQLGDGCVVHGWVEDLTDVYRTSRLAVAPLRYGAGMKGKVAEALAAGLPVVTTPTGVEGMPPEICGFAAVAETADGLAQATVELYGDEARWDAIHRGAPAAIDAAYGFEAVERLVEAALDAMAPRA